jgi:lysophospholipid acyltransferase (LPLAT)-like uncharacterized protein
VAALKLPVNWRRRLRFFTLEKILLPVAIRPFRLLVRSWRVDGPDGPEEQAAKAAPRLIIVTWHGMLPHLLRYAPFVLERGRRPVVLVSPSLDGRLLAATLAYFGIDHVFGTSNARAVSGARRLIARVAAGDVGVIAADGPRGPCGIAKPGVLEMAAMADARLLIVTTSTRHGMKLGSWDRSSLPLPFARLHMKMSMFEPPPGAAFEDQLRALQAQMTDMAQAIDSPVSQQQLA